MADSFTPTIAPQTDGSGNPPEQVQQQPDATEPVPITEQEVGEYREQDRYLPVSLPTPFFSSNCVHLNPFLSSPRFWRHHHHHHHHHHRHRRRRQKNKQTDCECFAYHEERRAADGKNRERRQGVRAGVRVRVYQLHHVRGGGEVPAREAKDDRRRGHSLRDDFARL